MSNNSKIYNPVYRKRKAYYTATIVFLSYYLLRFKARFFGQTYYKKQLPLLHLKNATRIKNRIQELQGLFIKFGQLVSNLSNILPLEFRAPLEDLQDKVVAKKFSEIEATILSELGKPYSVIFTDFDQEPIAAASIGQVHRAKLDGKDVVVKIQHANIETIAAADLEIIKNLVKMHAFFMDMQGLDHTYEQVKLMIEDELDYQKEAQSMQEIQASLKNSPELGVQVPEIYLEFNTKKILVSTFYPGVKISNVQAIEAWGLDPKVIAKRLLELYCKMVLVDGFYHADPHPGNILVNQEGEIILLDFGATVRLSETTKEAIPELIEAMVKNDTEETVLALRKLGFLGNDKDSKKFVEKLVNIFKEFLENEVEFDGLNFQNIKLNSGIGSLSALLMKIDLRDVSNNIRIPKEYILLNRTIVLLLGNTFNLAPELNAITVIRPYVKKHLMAQNEDFISAIIRGFKNQIATAVSLPKELSSFLKKARAEELEDELKEVNFMLRKFYKLTKLSVISIFISAGVYLLIQENLHLNLAFKIGIWTILVVGAYTLFKTYFKSVK
jgi:ubiquinone biosynthesis protein